MQAKNNGHGGKREGAGRPAVAEKDKLSKVFSLRVTPAVKRLLDKSGAKGWATEKLVLEARKILN
jgi:hypothetical protein